MKKVPGGLAKLTFDVIRNKQDSWWDKIFGVLKSPLGQTLPPPSASLP